MRSLLVRLFLILCACTALTPQAEAQFGGRLKLPGRADPIKKLQDELTRNVGEAVGVGAPIVLDQNTAFPLTQEVLHFRGKLWIPTEKDLKKPLPPGDYAVPMTAYCTAYSIHVPGRGSPYKMAPLRGKQVKALTAILVRGTIQKVPHDTLQDINWRIQTGLPISQWPKDTQDVTRRLAPECVKDLDGDFFENIHKSYDKARSTPVVGARLPSMESLMLKAGEPGKAYLQIERGRQILSGETRSAEVSPDLLYDKSADGLPRVLPDEPNPNPSPWSVIKPGVYGRITIVDGRMGQNLFEFRVTKEARKSSANRLGDSPLYALVWTPQGAQGVLGAAEWPTFGEIAGFGEVVAGVVDSPVVLAGTGLYITYSMLSGRQALIMAPDFSWSTVNAALNDLIRKLKNEMADEIKEENRDIKPAAPKDLEETIKDVLKDGEKLEDSSKDVNNWRKPGGITQADKDFETLTQGGQTKDLGGGKRTSTLPDGTKVTVYPVSTSTKEPTISITRPDSDTVTKIRYKP